MKRVIYILTLAVVLMLVLPAALMAEAELPAGVKGDGDGTVQSSELAGAEAQGRSLLDSIVEAIEDLLGDDDPNLDPPIGDVHPPDWDEPTEDPDGDDDGWSDQWK